MSKIRFDNGYFSSDVEAREQLADSLKRWINEEQAQIINNTINDLEIDPSALQELLSVETVVKNQSSTGKDIYEAFAKSHFFNANGGEYTVEDARSATPRHLSTFWKVEYLANNKDAGLQDLRVLFSNFNSEQDGKIVGKLNQDIKVVGLGTYLKGSSVEIVKNGSDTQIKQVGSYAVSFVHLNDGVLFSSGSELSFQKYGEQTRLTHQETVSFLEGRYGITKIPANTNINDLEFLIRNISQALIYQPLEPSNNDPFAAFLHKANGPIQSLVNAYLTSEKTGIEINLSQSAFKAQIAEAVKAELDDSIKKTSKILKEKGKKAAALEWLSIFIASDGGSPSQIFTKNWDKIFSPFFDGQKPANFVAMDEKMKKIYNSLPEQER